MNDKVISARFYKSGSGNEPVRDWLLSLSPEDRKAIGDDIRTAEFGWPTCSVLAECPYAGQLLAGRDFGKQEPA